MRKIYIMLLMSSVVLLTACDMLDIQPTGKVIPQTLAEYRALIATAYKNVPDARGLACFRSDELYVKDDSWEQAGIKKHITFHTARHTHATMLLTLGVDLYTVSKLLGHTNIQTTQIYAKLVDESKKKAIDLIPNIT